MQYRNTISYAAEYLIIVAIVVSALWLTELINSHCTCTLENMPSYYYSLFPKTDIIFKIAPNNLSRTSKECLD